MKKSFLSLVFLLTFSSSALGASGDRYNFRFQPLPLLVGLVNGSFDFKMSENWTLGPVMGLWNVKIGDVKLKASMIGVQGRYYFEPVFSEDTWYLAGGLNYATVDAELVDNSITYTGSASGASLSLGGGYHWFWESFNMALGAHLALGRSEVEVKDSNGNKYRDSARNPSAGIGLDYSLGWTF